MVTPSLSGGGYEHIRFRCESRQPRATVVGGDALRDDSSRPPHSHRDPRSRMMNAIGMVLVYAGVISILIGYVGIVFCGFAVSFLRGIRNLIIPFVAFGDAMRRFPILIWFWGGGIAGIAVGSLLVN